MLWSRSRVSTEMLLARWRVSAQCPHLPPSGAGLGAEPTPSPARAQCPVSLCQQGSSGPRVPVFQVVYKEAEKSPRGALGRPACPPRAAESRCESPLVL